MNQKLEWILLSSQVPMSRFPDWAVSNLCPTDDVNFEATSNAWAIYGIIAPQVAKTILIDTHKVRRIIEAHVQTDKEGVKDLLTLLIANIITEIWTHPVHNRELRFLVLFRCRLLTQITMSKNPLLSVVQRFKLQSQDGKILTDKNMPC